MALELIANSDAPYHDLGHTICVTLVGQEVIKGKHLRQGGVSPRDWLHFIISLLCHDIGYVRGICRHDGGGRYAVDASGGDDRPPARAPPTPRSRRYHIERGKLFVRERFAKNRTIDVDIGVRQHRVHAVSGAGGERAEGPSPSTRRCCGRRTSSASWPTRTTCGRDRRSSRSSPRPA